MVYEVPPFFSKKKRKEMNTFHRKKLDEIVAFQVNQLNI